jgi:hypothetical protein
VGSGEGKVDMGLSMRRVALLVGGILAVLLVAGLWTAPARAATCDTSWIGSGNDGLWTTAANWDHGVPTNFTAACIVSPSTIVKIAAASAQASALSLSGGTVEIAGTFDGVANHTSSLTLQNGGTISSDSTVELTTECTGQNCTGGGTATLYNLGPALANAGTIAATPGTGGNPRELNGDITNTGTIDIGSATVLDVGFSGRTLDNEGHISIENAVGADLTLTPNETSRVLNDTGGSITNNGGSGSITIGYNNTFEQGAGTTTPSTGNPAHPAVVVDNSSFHLAEPTVHYTGTGASTVSVVGTVNLNGNIASGQNLVINSDPVCPSQTMLEALSGFTNAGTLTMTGACSSALYSPGGTITNTGTLVAATTGAGGTREITGFLVNSGTFAVNEDTSFDGNTATLTQTAGTTSITGGKILDLTGSAETFELQGGVLSAPSSSASTPATLTGSLDNTGGNVIPGTAASAGDLAVGAGYTQGGGGTLTVPLHGTVPGDSYGQLGVIGSMSIAGTLVLQPLTGFTPSAGDQFTVLGSQTGSLTGTFSTFNRFPAEKVFPPGWTYGFQPFYGPHAASVTADGAAGLRVRTAGAGAGTVSSSPAGISNCSHQCDAPYFSTQIVTLTEHPGAGWTFSGWSGACTGFTATCHVSMSQARTVTATFGHRTTTALRSSANPSKVGRTVIYTATVAPHPNGGTVKYTSGGSTIAGCGARAVNPTTGKAPCSVKYRSKGTRRIQAAYSGNLSYVHSTSSALTETIKKR